MPQPGQRKLSDWVSFLTKAEIPVLKQTARSLEALRDDELHLNARSFAQAVKNDPLMSVKLLRYMQAHKHRSQAHEVMEIEQIVMMLGFETTFREIPFKPLVEEVLGRENMGALVHLLKTAHRAQIASNYAFDWAVRLHDLHFEEIRIATLLHDIAELLLWCFSPQEMMVLKKLRQQDKSLRSAAAQEKVFGFSLHHLQLELAEKWRLPELLITLMDDEHAQQQRVRNVALAVSLARHSANGWDDAALPGDYENIAKLLRMDVGDVMTIVAPRCTTNFDRDQLEV